MHLTLRLVRTSRISPFTLERVRRAVCECLAILALYASSNAVAAHAPPPPPKDAPIECSVRITDTELASGADFKVFRFHLSGVSPAAYLSSLYERLSQCAPGALHAQKVELDRAALFSFAQGIGVFPEGERSKPKAFEAAIANLGNISPGKQLPGKGTYSLPTTKIVKISEPLQQAVRKNTSQQQLDNICINIVGDRRCVARSDIKTVDPLSRSERTYVTIEHYRLTIDITLPAVKGKVLANDILEFIENRNPGIASDPKNLPIYDVDVVPKSEEGCPEAKAADVLKHIDWTGHMDAQASPVLVIERKVPGDLPPPVSLASLKHPFFTTVGVLKPTRLPGVLPPATNDPGHALHVAHTIGARANADGWTGLATNANVQIADFMYFQQFLRDRQNRTPQSRFYRVVNLSIDLPEDVCDTDAIDKLHINLMKVMRQLMRSEEEPSKIPGASPLYVFASPDISSKCQYTGDTQGNRPRLYTADNCEDLACLGRLAGAITVVPLSATFSAPRAEYRADTHSLAVAAPGTGILSADTSPNGQLGFRSRCGSSHAAPIVSALAAEVSSKYGLGANQVKARIFATARPLADSPEIQGKAIYLSGVIDGDRLLQSDPAQDEVWLTGGENKKIEGRVVFYGQESGFTNVPQNDDADAMDGGGVTRANLVAVKRVPMPPGTIGKPHFRNLIRNSDAQFFLSSAYQFDLDETGKSVCSLDAVEAAANPCLVVIRASDNQRQPVPLGSVDSIVLRLKK